jgi:hypothetical protein
VESFRKFQEQFRLLNENYLQAPQVDNRMFLRASPERRAPVRGIIDWNLLGLDFYNAHKETLLTLKLSCIVNDNVVVSFNKLRTGTGLDFTQATYFDLVTAANFSITKYANKNGSNGTAQTVEWFIAQLKRGSNKFGWTLDGNINVKKVDELGVVGTFFQLINCEKPECFLIEKMYSCWNWYFLSNRIWTFCFQFFNNSIGTKTRIAARYRNLVVMLDNYCTLCVKSNTAQPAREDFAHIFYDCARIRNTCNRVSEILFPMDPDPLSRKATYFTGIVRGAGKINGFFYLLTAVLVNYTVWQFRMKKIVPSIASILEDVDNLFDMCVWVSNKISETVSEANSPICRRWTARHHGRG